MLSLQQKKEFNDFKATISIPTPEENSPFVDVELTANHYPSNNEKIELETEQYNTLISSLKAGKMLRVKALCGIFFGITTDLLPKEELGEELDPESLHPRIMIRVGDINSMSSIVNDEGKDGDIFYVYLSITPNESGKYEAIFKEAKKNYLALDNYEEYTPGSDYQPATKKYVDTSITTSLDVPEENQTYLRTKKGWEKAVVVKENQTVAYCRADDVNFDEADENGLVYIGSFISYTDIQKYSSLIIEFSDIIFESIYVTTNYVVSTGISYTRIELPDKTFLSGYGTIGFSMSNIMYAPSEGGKLIYYKFNNLGLVVKTDGKAYIYFDKKYISKYEISATEVLV